MAIETQNIGFETVSSFDGIGGSALVEDIKDLERKRIKRMKRQEQDDVDEDDAPISKKVVKKRGKPSEPEKNVKLKHKSLFISGKKLKMDHPKVMLSLATELKADAEYAEKHRPKKRSDCFKDRMNGGKTLRQCKWFLCKYHLLFDISDKYGALKVNFPKVFDKGGVNLSAMKETCALDVAEKGGLTLDEVGVYMNHVRQGINLIELAGKAKLVDDPRANKLMLDFNTPDKANGKGKNA